MLRRADRLNDATAFVDNMPYPPSTAVWIALLSSCAICKNLELGRRSLDHLIEADRDNITGHILMSNLYAIIGMEDLEYMLRVKIICR